MMLSSVFHNDILTLNPIPEQPLHDAWQKVDIFWRSDLAFQQLDRLIALSYFP
jgi:hypothetical protein